MKGTRHNGRAGKKGIYNVKHNDRKFDIENSEHIDDERTKMNVYWDCYQGYFTPESVSEEEDMPDSFSEIEARFYEGTFSDYCAGQHERNRQNGHSERDRTTEQLRADSRTCPEETIYQIGDMFEHAPREVLVQAAEDMFEELKKRYGENYKILNWALHMDEATPHIHERHVFVRKNEYGEVVPQQEKALAEMGIPLKNPDKPTGKRNNRKIVFDEMCRDLWLDIVRKHGLELDRIPTHGGREYLEKKDYIQMKQNERIAEQVETIRSQMGMISDKREELKDLTIRIEDTERFIDEVSEAAYAKAVDAVAEKVQVETHNADLEEIEKYKKWILSPERKAPEETRKYAAKRLDDMGTIVKNAFKKVRERVRSLFRDPKVKTEVQKPVKESILAQLKRNQEKVDAYKAAHKIEHKIPHKKNQERGL